MRARKSPKAAPRTPALPPRPHRRPAVAPAQPAPHLAARATHARRPLARVLIAVNSLFSSLGANFTAILDDQVHGPINLGVSNDGEGQVKEVFRQNELDATSQHTLVLMKIKEGSNWTSPLNNVA